VQTTGWEKVHAGTKSTARERARSKKESWWRHVRALLLALTRREGIVSECAVPLLVSIAVKSVGFVCW